MPNWCDGVFRARGTLENIKRFIMNGLECVRGNGADQFKIEENVVDEDYIEYIVSGQNMAHIIGTRRHFLDFGEYDIIPVHRIGESQDYYGFATPFKAAWSIDEDKISEIAKEFHIKIRVNGFERGIEFEQLIEVAETGYIKTSSVIQWQDYEWECAMPLVGG